MRKIWPWEQPTDLPLSNGVVMRVVSVPPYVYADVHAEYPPPPAPIVEEKSATGDVEKARALPGTPEFDDYLIKRQEYRTKMAQRTGAFALDYGCVGWKYPGSAEFVDEAPEDYEPPQLMKDWGVVLDMSGRSIRKVAFIKFVLIRNEPDQQALSVLLDGEGTPTKEETAAAGVPFDSPGQTAPK